MTREEALEHSIVFWTRIRDTFLDKTNREYRMGFYDKKSYVMSRYKEDAGIERKIRSDCFLCEFAVEQPGVTDVSDYCSVCPGFNVDQQCDKEDSPYGLALRAHGARDEKLFKRAVDDMIEIWQKRLNERFLNDTETL
jgi:hypothetical protein